MNNRLPESRKQKAESRKQWAKEDCCCSAFPLALTSSHTMRSARCAAPSGADCFRLFAAYCLLPIVLCLLLSSSAVAQEVVDKIVATINGRELITYTDLLWQLALEPNTPLGDPRAEDLDRVRQLVVQQRLIAQEAEKLPPVQPTDEQVNAELARLINLFPSRTEFMNRTDRVGLTSEQLKVIVRQRVAIENYLNFRFRSFTFVTPQEAEDYYRNVYVPSFRRSSPGSIVPTLEEKRGEIENTLTERKIAADIKEFLENARSQAEIVTFDR